MGGNVTGCGRSRAGSHLSTTTPSTFSLARAVVSGGRPVDYIENANLKPAGQSSVPPPRPRLGGDTGDAYKRHNYYHIAWELKGMRSG